jgi:Tol biopolymer transport system component
MLPSDHWARARRLLEEVMARPEEERPAYLAAASISEPDIRREVESLLRAHDEAGDFLQATPMRALNLAGLRSSPIAVLQPGTRLGSFEILALLGAGGMGQVYRARDTRLDRNVAIKIIAPELASSPVSRERFEREARAISKLAHPHVCVLHDVGVADLGEEGARQFLVMELVEGETLRARLDRGALPLTEAVQYGIQMADALAAAHTQAIVHRDLKPDNIVLTKSGVKVLDFGLARFLHRPCPPLGSAASRVTEMGMIAGTIPYMSPEQLEGKDVDARADIFSFGAVLYEMVTGRKVFEGQSQASLISAILSAPYPSRTVTPRPLDIVIRTCMAKDPHDRWSNMHDVWLQLQGIAEEVIAPGVEKTVASDPIPRRWPRALPWALVAILGLGLLMVLEYSTRIGTPANSTHRLSVELGVDAALAMTDDAIALSTDGTLLAFVARADGKAPLLYVRRLDQLTATPLDGTAGASGPCFSPEGQWVAFFADAKLKKVPVTGGAVVTLAEAPNPRGMWWAEDGSIVFAPHNRMGLARVSSLGGPTQELTRLENGEITHRYPQVLPGGAAVLYTASTEVNIGTGATVLVQPLPSGKPLLVQAGAYFGRYAPNGHIVYMQDDTLFAVPFDPRRLEMTGSARRTIDGVESDSTKGSAQLAVSHAGTMVYIPGRNEFGARSIAWMDRTGTLTTLRAQPADWNNPEFSPDGRRLAIDIRRDGHTDIWVYDLDRANLTPLTFDKTNEEFPVWTADGTRIAYRSFKSATDASGYAIAWKRADGSGDAQVLVRSPAPLTPGSWHPQKNILAYVARMPESDDDVMTLPLEGDEAHGWKPGQPTAVVNSAAREQGPMFSPNGKWLSYSSNESGLDQVYVRPFPGPGARVMVSNAGGATQSSWWSETRSELVFTAPALDYDRVLMVAPYRMDIDSFRVEKPRAWEEAGVRVRELLGSRSYALHPDGVRVAIAPPSVRGTASRAHVTLVSNFFNYLRSIAPPNP